MARGAPQDLASAAANAYLGVSFDRWTPKMVDFCLAPLNTNKTKQKRGSLKNTHTSQADHASTALPRSEGCSGVPARSDWQQGGSRWCMPANHILTIYSTWCIYGMYAYNRLSFRIIHGFIWRHNPHLNQWNPAWALRPPHAPSWLFTQKRGGNGPKQNLLEKGLKGSKRASKWKYYRVLSSNSARIHWFADS